MHAKVLEPVTYAHENTVRVFFVEQREVKQQYRIHFANDLAYINLTALNVFIRQQEAKASRSANAQYFVVLKATDTLCPSLTINSTVTAHHEFGSVRDFFDFIGFDPITKRLRKPPHP